MKTSEILARMAQYPGSFMRLDILSPVPCLAAHKAAHKVEKFVSCAVVAGIEFQNRKDIRDAIADGLRGAVQPLPWGTWAAYPFHIVHTPKGATEQQDYVRFYPPSDAQEIAFDFVPTVQFLDNGQPIDRARAIELCGSKAESRPDKSEAYAINVANIVAISPAKRKE